MNKTLVVIDMQDVFVYPNTPMYQECISGVINQIRLAKRRRDHILIVEFDQSQKNILGDMTSRSQPTVAIINNLLLKYNKRHYVFKNANDGGTQLLHAFKEKNIPKHTLNVCGVYANYCVRETVETLATHLAQSKIKLIDNAISCYAGRAAGKKAAFKSLSHFKNVEIVS